ncbi:unnamed protein product [Adineta steineri]|uniref:SOCS box domain-containing protein n=1 Tax=Adineta steineri TaxID=433720 RepID=A0A818Q0Q1_9BILA|nr:unnamed protein product [Adineta steineri]
MGCSNGKQNGSKGNNKKRSSFTKVLRFQTRRTDKSSRPLSYTGINQHYQEHEVSTRPLSMYDDVNFNNLEIKTSIHNQNQTGDDDDNNLPSHRTSRRTSETNESITTNKSYSETNNSEYSEQTSNTNIGLLFINNSNNENNLIDENNWKYYIPLTVEKICKIPLLKDIIYEKINDEFLHILNRLIRFEKSDENEDFFEWFFDELEYLMHSYDDDNEYKHKSLLVRSIEQDRYDCMKYLFDYQLLPSKLDINTTNDQGRHCLLMLAHKNGPIDAIEYLLTRHLSCLDTNKFDLNIFTSLHHSCRNFNLSISELLLSHTNRKSLQTENSELHTPLDYWIECLCSLKKLKPTHIEHHSDSLRLDYLLNDIDYHSSVLFFQTIINHGGQLTKIPLRYIRSVLPQLTFEQKLSYVDHHVNLCCTLYKNRLSTLIRDYDNFKISIQAGEVLTEFIYALGAVQLDVQNRLAVHAYSSAYGTSIERIYCENNLENSNTQSKTKEHETLQSTMRMLYFKFFRLFQCIYNNPDVNVKNFQFEHIFRRVWIYWKEPVRAFIAQCKEKNSSLKSICRIVLFKRLINYPADIQHLPINPFLKQFVAYDNPFFVIHRNYLLK